MSQNSGLQRVAALEAGKRNAIYQVSAGGVHNANDLSGTGAGGDGVSAASAEPRRVTVQLPSELYDLQQWVLWRYDHVGGKPRKIPYQTSGEPAKTNDPLTWADYGEVISALPKLRDAQGIGFVFSEADPYTGVDLDDCLDDASRLKEWAVPILRRFAGTYAEVSPSGSGIKLWCRGTVPASAKFAYGDGAIEVYSQARYFTVTGELWPGAILEIADCQESLNWLLTLRPAKTKNAPPLSPGAITAEDRNQAIVVLSRNWPDKLRHNTMWALAGTLARAGWAEEEAFCFCDAVYRAVPTHDRAAVGRVREEVATAFARLGEGAKVFGIPTLKETIPSKAVDVALMWLGIDVRNQYAEMAPKAPQCTQEPDTWPDPLSELALIGLAGDVVRTIEPTTESDPAAILFQFLTMFGNIVGRTAHWIVEDTQHFTNLFVCIVGDTAKARKGTGYDRVKKVFEGVQPQWDGRILAGLSSGEGLIWAVRDQIWDLVAVKERGKPTRYEEEMVDAGIEDKRLLVNESEFARVLNSGQRQGNTLTAVMREAWDGKRLGLMTKTKAAQCGKPHVSIIAHITKEELLRCLTDTEAANGYANRFLFVCARRSKILPLGGERLDYTGIQERMKSAIAFAQTTKEVPFDDDARERWIAVYPDLSTSGGGLFGNVTARAEAQVRRLACLYALLDESPKVQDKHLLAGLQAWKYCSNSCRSIFGDATGDPTADAILALLKRDPNGMTRTEMFNHFQKHKRSDEIVT
jgi:hypothetical protein